MKLDLLSVTVPGHMDTFFSGIPPPLLSQSPGRKDEVQDTGGQFWEKQREEGVNAKKGFFFLIKQLGLELDR